MAENQDAPRPFVFAKAPTLSGQVNTSPEQMRPLATYLEHALGRPVRFVSEPTYAATFDALRAGRIDAAMVGEFASRQGEIGGGIEPILAPIGSAEQAPTYQSAILTRIDSGIHDLAALKGVTFGLVDEQSTSGYLVPRAMLREAGLDPDRDLAIRLFGRHQAVVDAVLADQVLAGAAHAGRLIPQSLDRGPDYARLRVLARSQPIPLGPLVVRIDLPPETRHRLTDALLRVHETDPAAAEVLMRQGLRFILRTRRPVPTLKSIAALAGVSYATVSRVVNGSSDVASETAARVAAIVKELGYRPNGNALVLQGQRAPLVGLVMPPSPDAEFAALREVLGRDLAVAGVPLVLCLVEGSLGDSFFPDLLFDGRLGALIVTATHAHDAALADLVRTGHAVIAVGVERAAPGAILASLDTASRAVLGAVGLSSAMSTSEALRTSIASSSATASSASGHVMPGT